MDIKIRKCLVDDAKDVYNLICELEDTTFDFNRFQECYYNKISDDKNYFAAAINQHSTLIGFISLTIDYQLHHCSKISTIEELIVNSNYRGKNIGAMLLKNVIDYSNQHNCDIIELTSNFSRRMAHKFYEKNKFVKTSYKFQLKLKN